MTDSDKKQVFELYLLHAELADRVSQRREGANRLHVSLLSGFLVVLATLLRFSSGEIPTSILLLFCGIVGMAISASWFFVIRSYEQLNKGKYEALGELEKELDYPFFKREWEILEQGKNFNIYWKLTNAERLLPWIFFGLFLLISLHMMICLTT